MKRLTTLISQQEAQLVNKLQFHTFIDGEFKPCLVEIKDGRIAAVSSIGAKECGEGYLIPSFTEAHLHLVRLARTFDGVDLRDCRDSESLVTALRESNSPWIVGWAFNSNIWHGPPLTQKTLNESFPATPVVLKNIDLHSGLFNDSALEKLGLRADAGFLFEEPFWEAEGKIPVATGRALEPLLLRTVRALNEVGITAVQSFDGEEEEETILRLCQENEDFTLRVMGSRLMSEFDERQKFPDKEELWSPKDSTLARFAPGPLKLFIDGALNSQTALMEEDYEGAPGERGIAIMTKEKLLSFVKRGAEAHRPLAVHAIGDKANRWAVEVFETLPPGNCRLLRHRIEHAQLLPIGVEERMAQIGLSATTLPPHLPFDVVPAKKHWGAKRCHRLHVFRSMMGAGVTIALTSDAPVAPFSPLSSLRIAVCRQDLQGETFNGEESLSPLQALLALTLNPAHLLFGDKHWGSIEVGKAADLVLLSANPLEMSPELDITVKATLFEGQLVFGQIDGGNA